MLKETRIRIAEENGLSYTGIGEDGECIFVGNDVDWTNYTEACDAYELEHPEEQEEKKGVFDSEDERWAEKLVLDAQQDTGVSLNDNPDNDEPADEDEPDQYEFSYN